MAKNGPGTVVTVRAMEAVEPAVPLKPAAVKPKKKGRVLVVDGKKPSARSKKAAAAALRGPMPSSHIASSVRYELVEEPDKRFRIVKTGKALKVRELPPDKERAWPDNRSRILTTSTYPFCTHAHLIITFPDGAQFIGSATMIGRHHAITCGHCVYSKANGGWARSIQFNAGQNDGTLPFGTAWVTRFFSFTGWTNDGNRDWDCALLILNQDLGDRTGWLGLTNKNDSTLKSSNVNVTGYPGDKGGQQMWGATANVVGVTTHLLTYNVYTNGGQSGSGVTGIWAGSPHPYVCGDHVAGPNGIPNTGVRQCTDKFNALVNWMNTW